mmetsp:Transcript_48933/g.163320  ORF Transcript_48933/g.163320 Transcript_48933/m.163320 type:complete len:284 (-) Transcript_48933:408-1259(-)
MSRGEHQRGCVESPRGERRGGAANDDQSDDPADGRLDEHRRVDASGPLEQGDARRRADLAVCGREGPPHAGADDDDERCAELDREAARRRDLRYLDAERGHDLVPVEEQPEGDADSAEEENVVARGARVHLGAHLARLIDDEDGGERPDRVGHVVGAVAKRVAARGKDLKVPEHVLRPRVEYLCIGVYRRNLLLRARRLHPRVRRRLRGLARRLPRLRRLSVALRPLWPGDLVTPRRRRQPRRRLRRRLSPRLLQLSLMLGRSARRRRAGSGALAKASVSVWL